MRQKSDFPCFSEAEMAARHAKVNALMERENLDGLLVYGAGRFASEIHWLTDWPGSREALVLFQQDRDPVVMLQLYNHVPMARVMSVIRDVRWAGANSAETVAKAMRERGLDGMRIGLVGSLPYRNYMTFQDRLSGAMFKDVNGQFRMMRTIRSAEEIARIRMASELTDKSIAALRDGLRAGMAECDIPALIEPVYLREGGYAGIHFLASMPMRDPDFPVPAQYQSSRVLADGDCVISEISGGYWGYSGQIHRTFSIGEGPTPEWKAMHDVAAETLEVMESLIKDGVTTKEVETAADIIHERGYTILDDLLHGMNQYPPIIQTGKARRHVNRDITFRAGMTITIQPNVMTLDEKMGLQFGESFIVTGTGLDRLNAFPREWVVCGG
jgi:Xaa-Pro aminopeptidase